jgi:hypothetical protein
VAHEHEVVVEVHGVVLGERAARAEQIHDLHGHGVFYLVLAGHGNVTRGEQRGAQGHVGHDVQHAAVVVAHQSQARRRKRRTDTRRCQPLLDLLPGEGFIEDAGDLVEVNLRTLEQVGDLRNRTGRTMSEPLAGHGGAIFQAVEGPVIDGGFGLQVEHDDRHAGALNERQHGVRDA